MEVKAHSDEDDDEAQTTIVRRSSRHLSSPESSKSDYRLKALEKLRQLKSSGLSNKPELQLNSLYDEVDETHYNTIMRDDFVVDDNGRGYMDNEVDDIFCDYSSDGVNCSKRKRKKTKTNKDIKGTLHNYFADFPKKIVREEKALTTENDDLLNEMLSGLYEGCTGGKDGALDETITTNDGVNGKDEKSLKRQGSTLLAPLPIKKRLPFHHRNTSTSQSENVAHSEQVQHRQAVESTDWTAVEEEVSTEADTDTLSSNIDENVSTKKDENDLVEWREEEDDWETVEDSKLISQELLKMYWLDAFEDSVRNPGFVYLFGRVQTSTGIWSSCCVVVRNIDRIVYFLPRHTKEKAEDDAQVYTEVKDEVERLFSRHYFQNKHQCRELVKKFAFGGACVPKEARVLEVRYPGTAKELPADITGETFSHIFNSSATSLEIFLTERDLKGPCWIEVTHPRLSSPQISYCCHEFVVDDMCFISESNFDENAVTPNICLLSLNLITALDQHNKSQIVALTYITNYRCSLDRPSTEFCHLNRHSIITKLNGGALPFDFRDELEREGRQHLVTIVANERALLNLFLTKLRKIDPDMILGHDMGWKLEMLACSVEKEKLGRLRRGKRAEKGDKGDRGDRGLTGGRLLVDARSVARELVSCASYDLTSLCSQLLHRSRTQIFASHLPAKYRSSEQLWSLLDWSWTESWLALSIIVRLNAIPLFIQITQIVGGILSRTLMGGRAERNEYLLLHAFWRNNIVCPDKKKNKSVVATKQSAAARKKAGYAGGLVLDPVTGLYDTYVLLLDFNSLYPSIIQEYNICFTTIDLSDNVDEGDEVEIGNIPDSNVPEGILPKEIRILVERRRQVKALMKQPGLSECIHQQYDIRQMGLKITANSIYGCLGFSRSRFYAKPLAALITAKGREVLTRTKQLIEKLGLTVIYGDTDSIMIDTKSNHLDQVKNIANEVKTNVNKCYKRLELETDGVYKRLLLLKKKKYAGIAVELSDGSELRQDIKGLDMVRRDWSRLATHTAQLVLDLLLTSDREQAVQQIHTLLSDLRAQLDANQVDLDKFFISKQLTKNPNEYADGKCQSHVIVAQRLNSTRTGDFHFQQGDTVSYLICLDGTRNSPAQRAYHELEYRDTDQLQIDTNYYLTQQIHPVVARLCEPIEETDSVRIAQCLGLDTNSYRAKVGADQIVEDDIMLTTEIDYTHCESFCFECPSESCREKIEIRSAILAHDDCTVTIALSRCPKCSLPFFQHSTYLINKLDVDLREYFNKYSASYFVCDDQTCAYQTRHLSFKPTFGCVCVCPSCNHGSLKAKYSAKMLYRQQCFMKLIVDLKLAVDNLPKLQKKKLIDEELWQVTSDMCQKLVCVCDKYLNKNAYGQINMSALFAVMKM